MVRAALAPWEWDFRSVKHWHHPAPLEVMGKILIDFDESRDKPMLNALSVWKIAPVVLSSCRWESYLYFSDGEAACDSSTQLLKGYCCQGVLILYYSFYQRHCLSKVKYNRLNPELLQISVVPLKSILIYNNWDPGPVFLDYVVEKQEKKKALSLVRDTEHHGGSLKRRTFASCLLFVNSMVYTVCWGFHSLSTMTLSILEWIQNG